MGRWAEGVFAGDAAMDFVAELVGGLVARAEYAVADPARLEPDEYYGQVVPCIVAVLAGLHELTGTAAIPEPAVVAGWKARYLAAWEAHAPPGRADADRRPSRRAAAEAAFDRLERLSRDVHPGG